MNTIAYIVCLVRQLFQCWIIKRECWEWSHSLANIKSFVNSKTENVLGMEWTVYLLVFMYLWTSRWHWNSSLWDKCAQLLIEFFLFWGIYQYLIAFLYEFVNNPSSTEKKGKGNDKNSKFWNIESLSSNLRWPFLQCFMLHTARSRSAN